MRIAGVLPCLLLSLAACSGRLEPIPASRFVEPDRLFRTVEANVRGHRGFEAVVAIDHARLAAEAGSPMPPARVLIWSDPVLEAAILAHAPLAALDLPLRVLAFEDPRTGRAAVIANRYDYIANRHSLPDDPAVRSRYEAAIARAMAGIAAEAIAAFPSDAMPDAGLVTLDSPHDFATTKTRVLDAIRAQSDTVVFAQLDLAARAGRQGVALAPLHLILFGAPGPGGKAMAPAPALGLDAFCQKLLVWQDAGGAVRVTLNDLLALARRQQVPRSIPLRVINQRLKKTFAQALRP